MPVHNRIREARQARGWSQTWVADRLGIKYQQLAHWERERAVPSLEWALRLAALFECEVSDLFWIEE